MFLTPFTFCFLPDGFLLSLSSRGVVVVYLLVSDLVIFFFVFRSCMFLMYVFSRQRWPQKDINENDKHNKAAVVEAIWYWETHKVC